MKLVSRAAACVVGIMSAVALVGSGCGSSNNDSGFDPDGGSAPGKDGSVHTGDDDTFDSGGGFDGTFGGDDGGNTIDAAQGDGAIFADATPDVFAADGACVSGDAGAAPFHRTCVPAVLNECDHAGNPNADSSLTAMGVNAALLNGANGNGYDDDCDGLVDEGCSCTGSGTTKDCYLVPASMVDVNTKKPVGWCTDNSKGSLDCAGSEFPKWSGTCRGAQPPYAHDVCAPGDFNCDGLPQNSDVQDCSCHQAVVTCPTAPIQEKPYPDKKNIQPIDGTTWIAGGAAAQATGWKWTVLGGDCDNILPKPTFAMYKGTDSTATGARIGTRAPIAFNATATPPEYVPQAGSPLIGVQAATGDGTAGGIVYPAFALSGDYIVQGEFDLSGQHYVCTQKVEVRAPGVRAELCWDTVGGNGASTKGNDIDLHFARLQGVTCSAKGWDTTCKQGSTYEDCWWNPISGCRDSSTTGPGWGYSDSADAACIGWGSLRAAKTGGGAKQGCTNPRLDRDNITCDPAVDDPNNQGSILGGGFCGPENINLDNPNNGDAFVVGVNHYDNYGGTQNSADFNAKVHVNLYCQGARVVSAGFNPAATPPTQYPVLMTPGQDFTGDLWTVATIKWNTANAQFCDVATVPSHTPDVKRDGPSNTTVCVDSTSTAAANKAPVPYANHKFIEATGAIPAAPTNWCKH